MALDRAIQIIKQEIAQRELAKKHTHLFSLATEEELNSLEEALDILETKTPEYDTLSVSDVIQSLILLKDYHEKNMNIVCKAQILIKLSEIEENLLKYKLSTNE